MRDGDMLRVNSHTTWRLRQLVRRWSKEIGLEAADPTSALEGIAVDEAGVGREEAQADRAAP